MFLSCYQGEIMSSIRLTEDSSRTGPPRVVDHIVERLAAIGVSHIFGVDGANIEDLYDAAHFCGGVTAVL
ncbi:MAG: acetolactate synthase, partial [Mycobacterium sp.]|nr:acetolactate synthase [Mycobacterium sp.]